MNWIWERRIPIFIIGALASMLLLVGHYEQNQAEYHKYGASSSVSSAAVILKPRTEQIAAKDGKQNSTEAEEKAIDRSLQRADHLAQVDMTLYALLGLIVGVIGITMIAATLKYTKDAAEAAGATLSIAEQTLAQTKEGTRRQLRAYLYIQPPEVYINIMGDKIEIHCKYCIENTGETPAYRVGIGGFAFVGVKGTMIAGQTLNPVPVAKYGQIHGGKDVSGSYDFKIPATGLLPDGKDFKPDRTINVFFILTYNDVIGAEADGDFFKEPNSFVIEARDCSRGTMKNDYINETTKRTV